MHRFLKNMRSYFFAGAFALIPMTLSIFLIFNLIVWIDSVFPTLTGIDLPFGVGVVAIVSITIIAGMVAKNFIGKKIIKLGNSVIVSVPVLNKIFLTVQQIMDVFINSKRNFFGQVVLVEYPKEESWCLGFVTSKENAEVSKATGCKTICVFVPTTPNPTSGFLLYVPESKVIFMDFSPEVAIKSIVSAGMVSSSKVDAFSNTDVNIADMIRKWKQSKTTMKSASMDPRD